MSHSNHRPKKPDFLRMMALQAKCERERLTATECAELHALELAWHNAAICSTEMPVRKAVP